MQVNTSMIYFPKRNKDMSIHINISRKGSVSVYLIFKMLTLVVARPCSSSRMCGDHPLLGCLHALWIPLATETGIRRHRPRGRPSPFPHTCMVHLMLQLPKSWQVTNPCVRHSPYLDAELLQTGSCLPSSPRAVLQSGSEILRCLFSLLSLARSPILLLLFNLEICNFFSYFLHLHLQIVMGLVGSGATSFILWHGSGSIAPRLILQPW
jgi:hypothetical protein